MERHERYDPEDIESLLSERGFDELLPDERSFVLRHVADRAEYERLRALLQFVRPDERERGAPEPDERVRASVMAAYRAQQHPRWRIWLNGLSLWLAPKEAPAYWRPALAFAALAVLIVAGVIAVWQFQGSSDHNALAALEQEKTRTPTPARAPEEGPATDVQQAAEVTTAMDAAGTSTAAQAEDRAPLPTEEPNVLEMGTSTSDATEDLMATVRSATEKQDQPAAAAAPPPAESPSHVVTTNELAQNMSLTNALGEVAKETASKVSRKSSTMAETAASSRTLADDPGVMALVTAGW